MQTPAWLTRIGADPRDDEDLRHKKSLLVLLAVLILPVSIIWGTCYLSFGSPVCIIPFVYYRRVARLAGDLRPHQTVRPVRHSAAPRHPPDHDDRADGRGRVPSRRRGWTVGAPRAAWSSRLPRGA